MGLFVYLQSRFKCVRCQKESNTVIQTKLLRAERDNASRTYVVGESEILDGLDDYCALHPWNGTSPLVVAVGDWDCDHCRLAWQWARAVFKVLAPQPMVVTLTELTTLQPLRSEDLEGINYVEGDLAELSDLWERPPRYNWPAGLANWNACSIAERSERLSAGYRQWCREVSGESDVRT